MLQQECDLWQVLEPASTDATVHQSSSLQHRPLHQWTCVFSRVLCSEPCIHWYTDSMHQIDHTEETSLATTAQSTGTITHSGCVTNPSTSKALHGHSTLRMHKFILFTRRWRLVLGRTIYLVKGKEIRHLDSILRGTKEEQNKSLVTNRRKEKLQSRR